MDSSIDPNPGTEPDNDDIPVPVDTLAIDGTRPQVGDQVSLKVGGSVTKVVNDTAYVTPQTVNGQPIPQEAPDADDMDSLEAQSASAGGIGSSY